MNEPDDFQPMDHRFRGFLPVVVDVETGGFNYQTDALLQIAAVILRMDSKGDLYRYRTVTYHVEPFEGANMDPKSLEVNGIDPFHPLRLAVPEKDALSGVFKEIRKEMKLNNCKRSILIGHNAPFDLNFVNATSERAGIKRNPFHPFSTLDTVTLSALAFGQTVLARAVQAAGLGWDTSEAHSAIYDAEKTADLFCHIVNRWNFLENSFDGMSMGFSES
jgi:ribonuclease T